MTKISRPLSDEQLTSPLTIAVNVIVCLCIGCNKKVTFPDVCNYNNGSKLTIT